MTGRVNVFCMICGIAIIGLFGCDHSDTRQQQIDSLKDELRQEQDRRHDLSEVLAELISEHDPDALAVCRVIQQTFLDNEAGSDCTDFRVQVSGVSMGCVEDCDTPARLQEAITAATERCKDYCIADKGCKNFSYSPPSDCAASECYKNDSCPADCQMWNACFLEQDVERWNCHCIDI